MAPNDIFKDRFDHLVQPDLLKEAFLHEKLDLAGTAALAALGRVDIGSDFDFLGRCSLKFRAAVRVSPRSFMTDFHRFMPDPLRERLKKSSQGIQGR